MNLTVLASPTWACGATPVILGPDGPGPVVEPQCVAFDDRGAPIQDTSHVYVSVRVDTPVPVTLRIDITQPWFASAPYRYGTWRLDPGHYEAGAAVLLVPECCDQLAGPQAVTLTVTLNDDASTYALQVLAPTPEPSTGVLFLTGVLLASLGAGWRRWRGLQ